MILKGFHLGLLQLPTKFFLEGDYGIMHRLLCLVHLEFVRFLSQYIF